MKFLLLSTMLISSFASAQLIRKGDIFSGNFATNNGTSFDLLDLDMTVAPFKNFLIDAEVNGEMFVSRDTQLTLGTAHGALGLGYALKNKDGQIIGIVGQYGKMNYRDDEVGYEKSTDMVGGKFFINLSENNTNVSFLAKRALASNFTVLEAFGSACLGDHIKFEGEYCVKVGENNLEDSFGREVFTVRALYMTEGSDNGANIQLGAFVRALGTDKTSTDGHVGLMLRMSISGSNSLR